MYRILPRRAVRDSNKTASYVLAKNRLTAVLTVYADGRKALMTIIESAKRPESFPRHFDTARILRCFHMAPVIGVELTIIMGLDVSRP